MSFVYAAVATVVGTSLYSANQAKVASNRQAKALRDQQAADARAKVEAETGAAVESNQIRVAQKRAYQANVLSLGGARDDTLGAPAGAVALGAGAPAGGSAGGSVLGMGAPVTSSGSTRQRKATGTWNPKGMGLE